MKHFFIAALALAACSLGMQAQEKGNPNPWFIQGGLGASYSVGDAGLGKLISPSGQIAAGKYFSPVWGARLAVSGWQGRYSTGNSHSFYYGAATVDGLMNVSQLIKKYPERPVDVSVLAGIGFNRAFEHSVSSFMARVGLLADIRLNNAFDFNIEATANGVSDRWNRLDDHSFDTYINLLVGITYKFKTGYKCPTCLSQAVREEINSEVNERRANAVAAVPDTVVRVDTVVVEKETAPAKVVKGIKSHVAFRLGKTVVDPNQEMNVLAIADYLKQFPEATATVTGYADNGTGNRETNLRLAKQRAEAVTESLVTKYGISRDRLTTLSMQGDEQPFQTNDWNRVVVIVAD